MKKLSSLVFVLVLILGLSTTLFAKSAVAASSARMVGVGVRAKPYTKAQLRRIRQFHFVFDPSVAKIFRDGGLVVKGHRLYYQKKMIMEVTAQDILETGMLRAVFSLKDDYLSVAVQCRNPKDNISIEVDTLTGKYRITGGPKDFKPPAATPIITSKLEG